MSEATPVSAEHVTTALPCGRCDYDLRGLPIDGVCPECAYPIARSRLGELADATWLERTAWGVRLLEIGLTLALIGWVVYVVLGLIIALASWTGDLAPFVGALGGSILAIATVIGIGGVWQVTTPQRGRLAPEPQLSSRQIARLVPVGLALYLAALAAAQLMPVRSGWVPPVAAILAIQITLVGGMAFASRLRWIASRLPDAALARRSASLIRVALVEVAIGVAMLAIFPFGAGLPATWMRMGVLIIVIAVLFSLSSLASDLPALRRQLRLAAAIARETMGESS